MSEALATLDEAIRMARRNGDLFWHPRMPNCIGWIHRELQNFEGAFKYDLEGLEIGHQHHVNEAEANSLINLGIDYSHSGDTAETVSAFHKVREIFERDAWFRWRYNIRLHAAMAEHALREGDTKKAREITAVLLETATKYEVHKYMAVAHKLLAEIALAEGDRPRAESEFGVALRELQKHPVPVVTWKIYAEVARLRSAGGDSAGAHDMFGRAREIVDWIAANVKDAALREGFLASEAVREVKEGAAQ
jgi:tetratricopeptide (TPR) repeat protein